MSPEERFRQSEKDIGVRNSVFTSRYCVQKKKEVNGNTYYPLFISSFVAKVAAKVKYGRN
jgi:hypothetical protein